MVDYWCINVVNNGVGFQRVTHVGIAEVGAHHVTLVWQSPEGDVELYEVSYWMEDVHGNISCVYSFDTNVTLRQLRRTSVYMFRVRLQ